MQAHSYRTTIRFFSLSGVGLVRTRLKARDGRFKLSVTPTAGRGITYTILTKFNKIFSD
jgi:hypothetical protein